MGFSGSLGSLAHFRPNELPYTLYRKRLYDSDIPREKWLNYLQTVETLI